LGGKSGGKKARFTLQVTRKPSKLTKFERRKERDRGGGGGRGEKDLKRDPTDHFIYQNRRLSVKARK